MQIVLGGLAPKLSKQLPPWAKRLLGRERLAMYQKMADALVLLSVQSIITGTEAHKARVRLIRRMDAKVTELQKTEAIAKNAPHNHYRGER